MSSRPSPCKQLELFSAFDVIESGDALIFSGYSFLHYIVRCVEAIQHMLQYGEVVWPRATHVGMAWKCCEGVFVIEQELVGCRIYPLQRRIQEFKGTIHHHTLNAPLDRSAMLRHALSVVGDDYGYRQLFKTFVLDHPDPNGSAYCSALYRSCLVAGGAQVVDDDPMPSEVLKYRQASGRPYVNTEGVLLEND